jgi:pyridinium-3,5-biscarboxylic acid mononucleotide sulfurtransferase
MTAGSQVKYEKLKEILRSFGSVAVAYSGGIDSTFLLHAACAALENRGVIALQGVSCLLPTGTVEAAYTVFQRHFSGKATLRQIELNPLEWKEFVVNTQERCYFCKKRMYAIFKSEMEKEGGCFLLDGTHADELKRLRPGYRAIRELGVQTPLLEAGFSKREIREQARIIGLANHDLPSNSCLATRIVTNGVIQSETLRLIDRAEHFLHGRGFPGCRVRLGGEWTVIEVRQDDLERIAQPTNRRIVLEYFQKIGHSSVVLDLNGRETIKSLDLKP